MNELRRTRNPEFTLKLPDKCKSSFVVQGPGHLRATTEQELDKYDDESLGNFSLTATASYKSLWTKDKYFPHASMCMCMRAIPLPIPEHSELSQGQTHLSIMSYNQTSQVPTYFPLCLKSSRLLSMGQVTSTKKYFMEQNTVQIRCKDRCSLHLGSV